MKKTMLIIPRMTIPEISALVTEFIWNVDPFRLATKEQKTEKKVLQDQNQAIYLNFIYL